MQKIYLDNAATSWPKPPAVVEAITGFLKEVGCNPGRGGYDCALEAGRIILNCRLNLAELLNVPSPEQIVFTANVTTALNIAIKGLLRPGDHVITSSLEHNAVLRPLRAMEKNKTIELDFAPYHPQCSIDPQDIRKLIKPKTKMLILTHSSNVTGEILPLKKAGKIARENHIFFVVDAAQTAGIYPVDFSALNADVLAFTGHKGLMGPPGTGGMALSHRAAKKMVPLLEGGTGSISDSEEQPHFLPDKFESGTLNTPGIAGLGAAIESLEKQDQGKNRKKLAELTRDFLEGAQSIPQVKVQGPQGLDNRTALVSITIEGHDLGKIAEQLDREFNIQVRSGLHCSPLSHKSLGTFPEGTLRFSMGLFNTRNHISQALVGLERCIKKSNRF